MGVRTLRINLSFGSLAHTEGRGREEHIHLRGAFRPKLVSRALGVPVMRSEQ